MSVIFKFKTENDFREGEEGEEIPATVNVRNIRARVYYEGLVNKCFQCGSTEHIKADCPARKSVNERLRSDQSSSYSGALKGVWNKTNKERTPAERRNDGKMTNLNQLLASSSNSANYGDLTLDDQEKENDKSNSVNTNTEASCSQSIIVCEFSGTTMSGGYEQQQRVETDAVSNTVKQSTNEIPLSQQMETDSVSNTADSGNGEPTSMEAEGASLKRGRDGVQPKSKEESDDSSLSDISDVGKEGMTKNEETATISGWQKVITRSRNKQLKLSQEKKRSKSASGKPTD